MNREELTKKLNIVGRALAQDNLIPVYKSLAFTGDSVMAFDDTLAIVAPLKSSNSFVVDGKTLMGLLTNCTSELVDFAVIKGQDLTIKAGKSTFKLPWQTLDEYLFVDPEDVEPQLIIELTEDIRGALRACLMIASDDLAQLAYSGVCVRGNETNVCLYSTDGDAVSKYVCAKQPHPCGVSFMMPHSFCDHVLKVMGDTEAKTGKLELGHEWAKVTVDTGYVLYGRLLQIDEPLDYEGIIKESMKLKPRYVSVPTELNLALSRARVVADPVSAPTLLTIEGAKLKLQTDSQLGLVNDSMAYGDKSYAVQAKVSAELTQRCATIAQHMFILPNCCVYISGRLLILVSNMG